MHVRICKLLILICLLAYADFGCAASMTRLWTKSIIDDGRIYGFTTWEDGYAYTTADAAKIFDKNGTLILEKSLPKLYPYIAVGDNCFFVQCGGSDGESGERIMFDFSGKELWSLEGNGFSGAIFSPNYNYIVSADYGDNIEFRIVNKQGDTLLKRQSGSTFIKFSNDGEYLTVTGHGIFKLDDNRIDTLVLDNELGFTRGETYFMDGNTKILIRESKPANQIRLYNLQLELLWSKEIKPNTLVNVFQDQVYCSTNDILDIYTLQGNMVQTLSFAGQKIYEKLWGSNSAAYCIVRTYIYPTMEWLNLIDKNGNILNVYESPYNTKRTYRFNEKAGLLYTLTTPDRTNYVLECYELE